MAEKITVQKNGVKKEVDARLEKDYAKNGWTILRNQAPTMNNPFASGTYTNKR